MPEVGYGCLDDLVIGRILGSGGFGTVYKASYKGETVALKQLHTNTKNKKAAMQSFRSETRPEVLKFNHPNIVRTLYVSHAATIEDSPFLVMEYIENKTLQHMLDDSEEIIDDARRISMALEIVSALDYIHQQNIAHLDLKPVNVLVTKKVIMKLLRYILL